MYIKICMVSKGLNTNFKSRIVANFSNNVNIILVFSNNVNVILQFLHRSLPVEVNIFNAFTSFLVYIVYLFTV